MSLSRQTSKQLERSVGVFENVDLIVSKAVSKDNLTLVKSLTKNRVKLDEAFENLYIDFKAYKKDINVSNEAFNAVQDNVPSYEYNDTWL